MLSKDTKQSLILSLLDLDKKSEISLDKSLDGKKTIVVLQRGWVVVGDYYQGEYENRLENASVIRKWGTSKGLGELALNGPQSKTELDKCGIVRYNAGAEVCRMDCNLEKWN